VRQALGRLGAGLDVRNVGLEGGEPRVESFGLLEPRAEVAGLKLLRRAEALGFLPPGKELRPPPPVLVLNPRSLFHRLVQVESENGDQRIAPERILGQRACQATARPVEATPIPQRLRKRSVVRRRR
jgi:hypothetical protein